MTTTDEPGLTPEQQQMFVEVIERLQRRRRIMLAAYALCLVILVLGIPAGLIYWARSPRDTFVGWVFFIPLALVGAVLWGFGRWARVVTKGTPGDLKLPPDGPKR